MNSPPGISSTVEGHTALVAVLMSPESEPARYWAVNGCVRSTGNSQTYGGAAATNPDGHGSHHYAQDLGIFHDFINKHPDLTGRQIAFFSILKCLRHLPCLVLLPISLEMKRFRAQATGITTLKDRK